MKKILFIIGAFLLAQVAGGLIVAIAEGSSAVLSGQSSSTSILCGMMLSSLLAIVATILICRRGWTAPLRWPLPSGRIMPVLALSALALATLALLTEAIAEYLTLPDYLADTLQAASLSPLALWAMAIIGPIAEEVACRYGIAGSLMEERKLPAWAVVAISAFVFSLLHLNPAQMLPAFIIGLLLSWLYVITGSLWPPLLCHALNNAAGILIMRANPDMSPETNILREAIGSNAAYATLLGACALLLILAIWLLRRITNKQKPHRL